MEISGGARAPRLRQRTAEDVQVFQDLQASARQTATLSGPAASACRTLRVRRPGHPGAVVRFLQRSSAEVCSLCTNQGIRPGINRPMIHVRKRAATGRRGFALPSAKDCYAHTSTLAGKVHPPLAADHRPGGAACNRLLRRKRVRPPVPDPEYQGGPAHVGSCYWRHHRLPLRGAPTLQRPAALRRRSVLGCQRRPRRAQPRQRRRQRRGHADPR